jgi:hypothetical protein
VELPVACPAMRAHPDEEVRNKGKKSCRNVRRVTHVTPSLAAYVRVVRADPDWRSFRHSLSHEVEGFAAYLICMALASHKGVPASSCIQTNGLSSKRQPKGQPRLSNERNCLSVEKTCLGRVCVYFESFFLQQVLFSKQTHPQSKGLRPSMLLFERLRPFRGRWASIKPRSWSYPRAFSFVWSDS